MVEERPSIEDQIKAIRGTFKNLEQIEEFFNAMFNTLISMKGRAEDVVDTKWEALKKELDEPMNQGMPLANLSIAHIEATKGARVVDAEMMEVLRGKDDNKSLWIRGQEDVRRELEETKHLMTITAEKLKDSELENEELRKEMKEMGKEKKKKEEGPELTEEEIAELRKDTIRKIEIYNKLTKTGADILALNRKKGDVFKSKRKTKRKEKVINELWKEFSLGEPSEFAKTT